MISIIQGKILSKTDTATVVLTAGGVGYEIRAAGRTLQSFKIGEETSILTYLVVREDAMELYGFGSESERDLFLKLLSVSGIGPRTGLHILDLGEPPEIGSAISRGDVDYLTKVSGIGKKVAERIVVELKSKLLTTNYKIQGSSAPQSDALGDVIDGLVSLGYNALQAREAVKKLDAKGKTSEQLLREALQRVK